MIRRYVPGALITTALIALIAWIATHTYWAEVELPTFPKGAAATNPFYAAEHLTRRLGARAESRHDIAVLPPANAVVVVGTWNWTLIPSRRERLERWVALGGRLVVDRGLMGDEREWERWAGVSRIRPDTESPKRRTGCARGNPLCGSRVMPMRPPGSCVELTADPAAVARTHYSVCSLDATGYLATTRKPTWALRDEDGHLHALRVAIGRGSVTMVNAWAFGNYELFSGDHGLLFAAVTGVRRGDEIYFLSDDRVPSLPRLIWRYGAPAVSLAIALLALYLWRTSVRFGPPEAPTELARRSLAEQIRGTGLFVLRFGGGRALHAAAARALTETAERHITRYSRLPNEQRIATLARLTGADAGELAGALNYAGPRRPGELRRVVGLIESVRRAIAAGARYYNRNSREGSSHAN